MLPDLSNLPPIPSQRGGDPNLLFAEMIDVIGRTIDGHPRSQQTRIGPSEMGHPCPRRLAHKMAGTPPVNTGDAGWRPTVGTAVHTWLEDAFRAENRRWREETGVDVIRWLLEFRVEVGEVGGEAIDGKCDIYDRVTATSNDWKIVGPDALKRYRRAGHPGEQYRAQGHLYGRGWAARGLPVDTVAITFLPSNGELRDAYFWHEPYREDVALAAIARANSIAALVAAAGPAAAAALPTADAFCRYCPFYLPAATELTEACPGHPVGAAQPTKTASAA